MITLRLKAWVVVLCAVLSNLLTPAALAQTSIERSKSLEESEIRRRKNEAESQERLEQQNAPAVQLQPPAAQDDNTDLQGVPLNEVGLPIESPCFNIRQISITPLEHLPNATQNLLKRRVAKKYDITASEDFLLSVQRDGDAYPFAFLDQAIIQYQGHCFAKAGVKMIVRKLSSLLIDHGYITTRLVIPEQDIASGTLVITLIPGVIHHIGFNDPTLYGTWKSAFSSRKGDLLYLPDLETGLEQLMRLPNQKTDMKLVPAQLPGETDINILVERTKPWRISLALDDSGSRYTGLYQGSGRLALYNWLGINDIINFGVNQAVFNQSSIADSNGYDLSISMPWGSWLFELANYSHKYYQKVAGLYQDFAYSGQSDNVDFKADYLFFRNSTRKETLQWRVGNTQSHSYVDGVEIEVQTRNNSYSEWAWIHKQYFGDAQLDLTLAAKAGVPWFNAQSDAPDRTQDDPTFFFLIGTLDATLSVPFTVNSMSLRYVATTRMQYTDSKLYPTEWFSIGNRWTVRGYDGELTLSAEKGWFLKNNLEIPLRKSTHTLYFGLDVGQVAGDNVENLVGSTLIGGAIGLRGYLGWGWSYEGFVGWPIDAPTKFKTRIPAAGFNLTWQY